MDNEIDSITISSDPSKYVTLPIQFEEIWRKYQTTLDWFWTVHDIYVTNDKEKMEQLFNEDEQQYILKLLTVMFTTHYTVINKELFMQLMSQVEIKEAAYFYGSQADTKKTHCLMYSMLLDELLGGNSVEKNNLIKSVVKMPSVRHLICSSILATSNETNNFAQRLLAFATLQGIVFPAIMVLFKWIFKMRGSTMSGLAHSNDNIWRDEKLNLSFSTMLFKYIEVELSEEEAHQIIKNAVEAIKNLLAKELPTSKMGMDVSLIEQFIENAADKILTDIDKSKIYNKESPFDWIEDQKFETSNQMTIITSNVFDSSLDNAKFDISVDF